MRIVRLALAASLALAGCADLDAPDAPDDTPVAATSAALADVMGNAKQNNFNTPFTALADFCNAGEICQVTDFSGDGRADLVAIDPALHRVRLARNTFLGLAFDVTSQTLPFAIAPRQAYAWGDANLDGKSDLFVCDQASGRATVLPMASTSALDPSPRLVATGFCAAGDQFRVGDVDHAGGADALRFRMNAAGDARGDVFVALGNGTLGFAAPTKWHDWFGIDDEQVLVADLDGNGADDLIDCIPGNGVFIAQSNGVDQFVRQRRPLVGVGPAATRPPLTDFIVSGQTCLTGDFDGGGKQDLVAFFGGVGEPIGDFHDTRGDVMVALSHPELDFTDSYRLGTPRVRSESFCLAGEVCGVGDLNGDGRDDVISFAHGTGGVNTVKGAFSSFDLPRTWIFELRDIFAHVTEGTGDKPLVLALSFRSTIGVRGSTVIARNAYNEDFATGIVAGGPRILVPAPVGQLAFGNVRLRSFDNLMHGEKLEILGTVVVVMEKDLSAAAAYSGLMDEATRALTGILVTQVESKTLASFLLGGGFDLSMDTLANALKAQLWSALDDLIAFYITGLFDPDDFIGVHVAVFPALDKEMAGLFSSPDPEHVSVGVPGEGVMGGAPRRLPLPRRRQPALVRPARDAALGRGGSGAALVRPT